MSEKKEILFNLLKSILFGLLFPTVFCWFFIWDPIEKDFRLIVQKKIVTNGIITKAKFFEDVVGTYDEEYVNVDGYEFSYTFFSNKGESFTNESFTNGELPNDQQISQIPFQVNIEYLEENPKINRIVGLLENNESLLDILRHELVMPLLLFIFCCYIAFKIIKRGAIKYKKEMNYIKQNT
jgi:hypothetical protein